MGTAVIAEHIATLGVDAKDIRPWIVRDVEKYRECQPDDLLSEFLYACKDPNASIDKASLYKECLEAVLPICNGEYRRKKVDSVESSEIKTALKEYIKLQPETSRYAPFVRAANCALRCLSDLRLRGLTCAKDCDDDSNILFHRSDPKEIRQEHLGRASRRKPDAVIVPWAAAKIAWGYENQDAKKADFYQGFAPKDPKIPFSWEDVRCALEFKSTRRKLDQVPARYEVNDYMKPMKPFISISVLKELEDADLEPKLVAEAPADVATPSSKTKGGVLQGNKSSASERPSSDRVLRSQTGQKRESEDTPPSQPESKRAKPSQPESDPDQPPAVVQGGLYAAEIFAAHLGTQHVINLIIVDDVVYIWRYDRQGTIQCSGINFVQDLPRFLVLLLAMQRFGDNQWGLNELFKVRKSEGERCCELRVDDHSNPVELRLSLPAHEQAYHYGLKGRSTNVLPVTLRPLSKPHENTPKGADYPQHNMTEDLVIKLFWPEDGRDSEEDILKKVYEIAKDDHDVQGHVPEFVWAHKFKGTSTAMIRVALKMANPYKGARTLCGIVFRRLLPITDLSGKIFLRTWWQTAKCHSKLWKGGVHHRDISASNLMYYLKDNQPVGVVNDFDLASTKQGPTGNERTGTVPFMALELLSKPGRDGHITHIYQHDAEALLWVLVWVSLRYDQGILVDGNRPLDDWLKVDAAGCRKEKSDWLTGDRHLATPSPSHAASWEVVQLSFDMLYLHYGKPCVVKPDDLVFAEWLEKNVVPYLD